MFYVGRGMHISLLAKESLVDSVSHPLDVIDIRNRPLQSSFAFWKFENAKGDSRDLADADF